MEPEVYLFYGFAYNNYNSTDGRDGKRGGRAREGSEPVQHGRQLFEPEQVVRALGVGRRPRGRIPEPEPPPDAVFDPAAGADDDYGVIQGVSEGDPDEGSERRYEGSDAGVYRRFRLEEL